jgi:hypothetical protein
MSLEQSPKLSISRIEELKRKAMQAFFFNEDDLTSNRVGELSDKQKQRFLTSTRVGTIVFVLSGLVLAAIFVWSWEEPLDQLPWAIPAFMIVSFLIIGIYVYRLGSKVYRSGIVESTTGRAIFKKRLRETFLQVGGKYFRAQRKFRQIFVPDVQYKIYYAPSDNTIVSVEILD